MRRLLAAISFAVFATVIPAQVTHADTLTNWVHYGGAPNWTDNFQNGASLYGQNDRLNNIDLLQFDSGAVALPAGTYVASCRLVKFQDANGIAPIDFGVAGAGIGATVRLEVAQQPVDQWVWTPELVFEVPVAGPVTFHLLNTDRSTIKQNYDFDAIVVGRIEVGKVVYYESMGRRWGHAWGAPYYSSEVADPDSPFGYTEKLNYVWWVEWGYPWRDVVLQPGVYTANVRLKKLSALGADWLDLKVDVGGTITTARLQAGDQIVGQYVYTPNLSFSVQQANTLVKFQLANTTGTQKRDYHIDAFLIRSGQFENYGTGCPSSLGALAIAGGPPTAGGQLALRTANVPSVAALMVSPTQVDVDLSFLGMTGCRLLQNFDLSLPMAVTANVAEVSLPVPPIGLFGRALFLQTLVVDPGQNALSLVTSNGGKAVVGR